MIKAYIITILLALLLPNILLRPSMPEPVVSGCAGITPIPMNEVYRDAGHRACFNFLASHACGNREGAWREISPGRVECLTHQGRSTKREITILP